MLPLLTTITVLLTGCSMVPETRTPGASESPLTRPGQAPIESASAAEELAAIAPGPRRTPTSAGYQRTAFGSAWADVDRNGCNQRDDVLQRDALAGSLSVAVQGRCDHDVLAGVWIDPYAGHRLEFDDLKDRRQAQAIQIDHVVPLAEAWVSGAAQWTPERRRLFANDLSVLLAVDGPTNASKGSGDPAAWRPRKAYQCTYAQHWIQVKTEWALAVDVSERAALETMLGFC